MLARLSRFFKGIVSLFVGSLEASNPKALLQTEIDSLQEATAHYNKGLAKQAAEIQRLKTQIERDRREYDKYRARITALVQAGHKEEAARLALNAKNLQENLQQNAQTADQAEQMYVNLTKQRDVCVREAQRRIDSIKQKMSQAEIAESQAKLAEMSSKVTFDIAGSGANLERLEEQLDNRVADAQGKARVASDAVAGGSWKMKAEEEAALESAALAEFMNMEGLASPANPAVTRPLATGVADGFRELGPG